MTPGESVYGEKRISVDETVENSDGTTTTTKMRGGSRVLYHGAASGTSVSHVADLVGPTGFVYAVEFSNRSGRDLIAMAAKRPNVVPIADYITSIRGWGIAFY
ncbi:hypothetical protein TrVFT333_002114 [Trichoderma virens FT-333]|nr:hypothetical protein TrVFT333_002114 [Trichoderma virens FT-333]